MRFLVLFFAALSLAAFAGAYMFYAAYGDYAALTAMSPDARDAAQFCFNVLAGLALAFAFMAFAALGEALDNRPPRNTRERRAARLYNRKARRSR